MVRISLHFSREKAITSQLLSFFGEKNKPNFCRHKTNRQRYKLSYIKLTLVKPQENRAVIVEGYNNDSVIATMEP